MAHSQHRGYQREGDRTNRADSAIAFVFAIQQEQCPMGRGACVAEFLDNPIPNRCEVGHRT